MKFFLGLPVIFFIFITAVKSQVVLTFSLFPEQSDILIYWTINAGASCDQMNLEYSTDSNFYFPSTIYNGSFPSYASSPTSFNYTHTNPSTNQRSFYRLNLGICGYSQVLGTGLGGNVYPNPFNDFTNLLFQNPNNYVLSVYVYDHNGQLVLRTPPFPPTMGTTYQLYRSGLPSGLYFFIIASSNMDIVSKGKFFITDNM